MLTLASTLDLLYLCLAIAVLWIAGMLTWLLFEVAMAAHRTNRIIRSVEAKVIWLEDTIKGIGERLESSAGTISTLMKGGKTIAKFIRDRQAAQNDDDCEEEEEEELPRCRKKSVRRRVSRR
ncbi:hypothetical protein GF380_00720 [Candidatus Uhrbacteria bacterium]|nr:hypothetical protein [Candidatus Uhrbacteria bacterium]MBD3283883.1 hypothetical protein [Candidatus Uhrbacteria bacterium]